MERTLPYIARTSMVWWLSGQKQRKIREVVYFSPLNLGSVLFYSLRQALPEFRGGCCTHIGANMLIKHSAAVFD
jgi:hypothetical protein